MEISNKEKKYHYELHIIYSCQYHVHLLIDVNPKPGVYYVVKRIKAYSSIILRNGFPELRRKLPTL
jgi:REP element-mobilizing transposase RayT